MSNIRRGSSSANVLLALFSVPRQSYMMDEDFNAIYVGTHRLGDEEIDPDLFRKLPDADGRPDRATPWGIRGFAAPLPFLPGWRIVLLRIPNILPPAFEEFYITDGVTRWRAESAGSWARVLAGNPQITSETALLYASLYLFRVSARWLLPPSRGEDDAFPITKNGVEVGDYEALTITSDALIATLDVIEDPVAEALHYRLELSIDPLRRLDPSTDAHGLRSC